MLNDLPDHPTVRDMERSGYPGGKAPRYPRCPVCGRECETVVVDIYGTIFACDNCVREKEAWGLPECYPGKEDL